MAKESLDLKEKFIHRDISWLAFNERVLEEASDQSNPLLERAKFLAIFVNNLDEFFMVRLSGIKRLIESGYNRRDQFGYYPQELYTELKIKTETLVKQLYTIYHGSVTREMEKNHIRIKKFDILTDEQKKFVKRYFDGTLFPIITPMAVDQGHPFPILPSKTIAFAVTLKRYDTTYLAIICIPRVVPRLLKLPAEGDEFSFILIDEIIRTYIEHFFRGYKMINNTIFRVIRDSELLVAEEYAPDLLEAIQSKLKKRPEAAVVYLETEKSCTADLLDLICQGLDFPKTEVAIIDGSFDLTYLFQIFSDVTSPELHYRSFVPKKVEYASIFERIKERDLLLHLPFQSFQPTVDLIQASAQDPDVLAIKMTLYRVNENSGIVKGLKEAAKNGKHVTVLVEIKARFDEEKNINWVRELEEAGCHVIYGIAGIKIHSKITLVVRKEEGKIRRYAHLSTGNYNEKTALIYTDCSYFTVNDDLAKDLSEVFNVITGYSLPSRWKRVVSSPNDLRQYFIELIEKEVESHQKNKNGRIIVKMNSLEDTKIIEKLYEASCKGVEIKLLVRGICCLVPGIPGLSENIHVKSIVGRFLEHSRIYIFNNNTNYRVFLSSADWMTRNFDRRIELLFEIYKDDIKEHLRTLLEKYWGDTLKSRVLLPEKIYTRQKESEEKYNVQEDLINYYAEWNP